MSEEDDSDDKSFEPSQKRLDDLREKGRIPRSPDLLVAAAFGGVLLAIAGPGSWSMIVIGQTLAGLIDHADSLSLQLSRGARAVVPGIGFPLLFGLAPMFLLPAVAVLAVLTVKRAFLFTPDNLMPKLSRISPIANAGQKFGRRGLFEFGKSFVKLCLVSAVLGWFLLGNLDQMLGSLYLSPAGGAQLLFDLLLRFLFIVFLIAVVLGGTDYIWQVAEHHRSNRMSRKDMMDEHKESEGDPQARQERRSRGQELALNQMLADVPKADVVIVNPTHYAVALKWDRRSGRAPVCVAKGVDAVAARIREKAVEAKVPIHSDPPTARALYATVEIGDEIQRDHYRSVAAAIRFAEAMRKRAKGGAG
ncbi:EscU/YscU/HrcU family type III secretion system export apparatus switch protein [Gemmobacter denitrificans]|uniref:Flagellar type III secretion system protein FlhB n=1 Tax=Gemmobacter denitrificans TaxID=3123040 RepID=A0ABU8BVE4_9RHOB